MHLVTTKCMGHRSSVAQREAFNLQVHPVQVDL